MTYLAIQMAVFLVLSACLGVITGWWINQIRHNRKKEGEIDEKDVFAIKSRLDQCFDENAALRRELKRSKETVKKLGKKDKLENIGSDDTLKDKIKVLMEDLQLRDDTILALEKELEMVRNTNS